MIKFLERISVVGLLFMVAIIAGQILMRFFPLHPFIWSDELARILNIWIVFIAAYVVLVKNEHVKVDYLVNFLPPRWQMRLDLLISFACGIFCCSLAISTIKAISKLATAKTAALGMPMPLFFIPTFICSILMISFFLVSIIKALRSMSSER